MGEPEPTWPRTWRGRWIWHQIHEAPWLSTEVRGTNEQFAYLKGLVEVGPTDPGAVPIRVLCDGHYVLHVNGVEIGCGPARSEPAFLAWDDYDIGPLLHHGTNTIVALCRHYGSAVNWWVPAPPTGSLGRGGLCLESHPDAALSIQTDERWHSAIAPWEARPRDPRAHGLPAEVVDGRRAPAGLHDPDATRGWAPVTLPGGRFGTLLARPPCAPFTSPEPRGIPHLDGPVLQPVETARATIDVLVVDDPLAVWSAATVGAGTRVLRGFDLGRIALGRVRLVVRGAGPGDHVDVLAGEERRGDGWPEVEPRRFAARYVCRGDAEEEVTFFEPVGLRFLAIHSPPGVDLDVEVIEGLCPRPDGASFQASDPDLGRLWETGVHTVDLCSTDAFVDCPGREQRAWVGDGYVQTLVSLVANPDLRLAHRNLRLLARSRTPDGLLAMAAASDLARVGVTIPDFSLHWIRTLAALWHHTGDTSLLAEHRPTAERIIDWYEQFRGPTGLLEDVPGWVFIDWAQVGRDTVTGAHDALYAAALRDYATLPGATDVTELLAATGTGFERLWDAGRGAYVDAIGRDGARSRRISQHTNATALVAGIVPAERVGRVLDWISEPRIEAMGGRLVITATFSDADTESLLQNDRPESFDEERDVVACQPFAARSVHDALAMHGRTADLLASIGRWTRYLDDGTFHEHWQARPGTSSRCHGFSATPTFDLTRHVLGVRPLTPGYSSVAVAPALGPLEWAAGRVPTPLGWLGVRADSQRLTLEVPAGMRVSHPGGEVGPGHHEVALG